MVKQGRVRQWNLETGKFIAELHPGVSTGYWASREVVSPDGKRKLKTNEPDFTASITGPSPSESGQVQHQGNVGTGAFSDRVGANSARLLPNEHAL